MHSDTPVAQRFAAIIAESQRIGATAPLAATVYVLLVGGVGIYFDLQSAGSLSLLLLSLVTLIAGYFLAKALLENSGLAPDGLANGFGTYFGISFLSGIAIVVGIVLLIIPGLVLTVRWAPAFGYGLVDGDGATDAMGKAWATTGPHFWPIAGALAVPFVINIGVMAFYFLTSDEAGNIELAASLVGNLLATVAGVMGIVIALATYSLLGKPDRGVADIFD